MADLFDIKVGGAGWHITSHLIALVALFVACFAITGYITFRDDSVPGTALKDYEVLHSQNGFTEKVHYERVVLVAGAVNGAGDNSIHLLNLALPAGAVVVGVMISMENAGTGTDLGDLNLEIDALASCTVGGTPTNDVSGNIDYNGTTKETRVAYASANIVVNATENRFCLAASNNATATGGEVIDCFVNVRYPPGVTPV